MFVLTLLSDTYMCVTGHHLYDINNKLLLKFKTNSTSNFVIYLKVMLAFYRRFSWMKEGCVNILYGWDVFTLKIQKYLCLFIIDPKKFTF